MDKTISIIQFTQNGQQANVLFSNTGRVYWLKTITDIHDKFAGDIGILSIQSVLFVFDEQILPKDIKPFHLVTLACLIHYFN